MNPKRHSRYLLVIGIGAGVVSFGELVLWIWTLIDDSTNRFEIWFPPFMILIFAALSVVTLRQWRLASRSGSRHGSTNVD